MSSQSQESVEVGGSEKRDKIYVSELSLDSLVYNKIRYDKNEFAKQVVKDRDVEIVWMNQNSLKRENANLIMASWLEVKGVKMVKIYSVNEGSGK